MWIIKTACVVVCDTRRMERVPGTPRVWAVLWRSVKVVLVLFLLLFVAAVIWRMPVVAAQDRADKIFTKKNALHIEKADVDGSHLPSAPSAQVNDATVLGIDSNHNAIRDDVERSIFDALPIVATTSTEGIAAFGDANFRFRAAQLQLAKSLEFSLREVDDSDTYTLLVQSIASAKRCMLREAVRAYNIDAAVATGSAALVRLEHLVFNTDARLVKVADIERFQVPVATSTAQVCDIIYPGERGSDTYEGAQKFQ